MPIYKFRDCLLNTAERSVIKGDKFVELTTKTFDVLQYLVENAGKIVTKDELLGTIWNGSFVEESNLPVHVSKIRRSLATPDNRRIIETVQGTGYRFLASIQVVNEDSWLDPASKADPASSIANGDPPSIAVLPFENDTGQSELEYLTDGLTEELINRLSEYRALTVIGRNTVFRYKHSTANVCEIGSVIGASTVLTGRVRSIGGELTVSTELTSASSGKQIWGSHYQKCESELFYVQEQIVSSIVDRIVPTERLSLTWPASVLTRAFGSSQLYFKGRQLLERHTADDMYRAIDLFKKSISLDHHNIHSRVEIFESYRSLYTYDYISYDEFQELIRPVIADVAEMNGIEKSDAAQIMYCDLNILDWRFAEAAENCRKALSINPNSLKGRLRFSDLLLLSRRFKEALEQLERLMIIDPLSLLIYARISRIFYWMGDYENAVLFLNDALDLDSRSHEALALRGHVRMEMGDYDNAMADFHASNALEYQPAMTALTGVVYARQGNWKAASEMFDRFALEGVGRPGYTTTQAYIHLVLGNKDDALSLLEQAFSLREPDLRALNYDRRWLPLRTNSRFKSLVQRIGLPILD
jgi:TolB-like protein/tetratricopeptide (TPR) repeat protein